MQEINGDDSVYLYPSLPIVVFLENHGMHACEQQRYSIATNYSLVLAAVAVSSKAGNGRRRYIVAA